MDASIPLAERKTINEILMPYDRQKVQFHGIRTRIAGKRRFISLHVLVPGEWTVQCGHGLWEEIESVICKTLPNTNVLTHLEPYIPFYFPMQFGTHHHHHEQ